MMVHLQPGRFEGWPDKTAEITMLRSMYGIRSFCCFVVYQVFVKLRMLEEKLSARRSN